MWSKICLLWCVMQILLLVFVMPGYKIKSIVDSTYDRTLLVPWYCPDFGLKVASLAPASCQLFTIPQWSFPHDDMFLRGATAVWLCLLTHWSLLWGFQEPQSLKPRCLGDIVGGALLVTGSIRAHVDRIFTLPLHHLHDDSRHRECWSRLSSVHVWFKSWQQVWQSLWSFFFF